MRQESRRHLRRHEAQLRSVDLGRAASRVGFQVFFFFFVGGIVGLLDVWLGGEPRHVPFVICGAGLGALTALRLIR